MHLRAAAPPVRVIIAGGRDFNNSSKLQYAMYDLMDKTYTTLSEMVVISGMARGADLLGAKWANDHGVELEKYPALWRGWNGKGPYNNAAGYQRNERMAKTATHLIAFWDGKSKGTRHMINLAHRYDLDVTVVEYV